MNEAQQAIVAQTDWPKREADATADALILHGARIALAMQVAHEPVFQAWMEAERGTEAHKVALRAYLDSTTRIEHRGVDPQAVLDAAESETAEVTP